MGIVTKTEYARMRGWSQGNVSHLLRRGVIVQTEDGKIDSEDADRRIAAARHPGKDHVRDRHAAARAVSQTVGATSPPAQPPAASAANPADATGYHAARTAREQAAAKLADLEYQTKAGQLMRRDHVVDAVFDIGRGLREALAPVPDRLAQVLLGQTDAATVHRLIADELDRALHEAATRLSAVGGPATDPTPTV